MNRRLLLLAALVPLPLFGAACASDSSTMADSTSTAPDFAQATDAWHADRVERLAAPDGWLTLVTLAWLQPGPNRIARDPNAEVAYAGLPADELGVLHLTGDEVRFEPAADLAFEGLPEGGWMQTDLSGDPTVIAIDTIRFYVIDRGGRLAVRMKDENATTRTNFAGIERFDANPEWCIVAEYMPVEAGTTVQADSIIGVMNTIDVAARARFVHEGHEVDMILPNASGKGHYIMFADESNGDSTYVGGRYLLVEPSTDGQTVVLDFNRAYNPPCSFTEFATCGIPVEANRLPFQVTAGERWAGTY